MEIANRKTKSRVFNVYVIIPSNYFVKLLCVIFTYLVQKILFELFLFSRQGVHDFDFLLFNFLSPSARLEVAV